MSRRGGNADGDAAGAYQIVFVVEEGVARERRVTTGLSDLFETEIMTGLSPGDEIVVGPPLALRSLSDGDPVVAGTAASAPDTDTPR